MLELFPTLLLSYCDKVVTIINKPTAKGLQVMSLLRHLVLHCLQHKISFKAQ